MGEMGDGWLRWRLEVQRWLRAAGRPLSLATVALVVFAAGLRLGAQTAGPQLVVAVPPGELAGAAAWAAVGGQAASEAPGAGLFEPVLAAEPGAAGRSVPDAPDTACGPQPQAPGPAARPGARLDLNRATVEELDALPGIGPVLARRIVQFRERFGPFRQPDDLLEVPGIGPRVLERLQGQVEAAATP